MVGIRLSGSGVAPAAALCASEAVAAGDFPPSDHSDTGREIASRTKGQTFISYFF